MSYVITDPSRRHEPRVLHRNSCKELHPRSKRTPVVSESSALFVADLRNTAVVHCTECMKGYHYDRARAEAWLSHLLAAHNYLAESRAERERQERRMAARAEFLAQVEPVRAACEIAWGRRVEFGSYNWNGNLALKLYREDGHSPCDIYLTAFDGERVLKFEGLNHSTGLINTPVDAYRLAGVFSLLEGWVAPEPLSVPEGAPDFYAIR